MIKMTGEQRRYQFRYMTEAKFTPAVSSHFFKLRAIPCLNSCQRVESHQLAVLPSGSILNESTDGLGNLLQFGEYHSPHDYFRMTSEGIVCCGKYRVKDATPSDIYLFPSKLTQYDLPTQSWAQEVTKDTADMIEKASRLMLAVHQHLHYQKQTTDNNTTAMEVFQSGLGVCQDYAHLMIALCRSVGIRSRYVNGLVLGEGETHAWVEVYDGEAWLGFDPTYNKTIDWGYIKIAHGRDVSDCPSNRGQFFARTNITEQLTIKCEMKEI